MNIQASIYCAYVSTYMHIFTSTAPVAVHISFIDHLH